MGGMGHASGAEHGKLKNLAMRGLRFLRRPEPIFNISQLTITFGLSANGAWEPKESSPALDVPLGLRSEGGRRRLGCVTW